MLDISKMDPYVVNILKEHRWFSKREYDISHW